MDNQLLVIDADGHIIDREDEYRERLPSEYRHRMALFPNDAYDRQVDSTAL
jgi:hypothetical protein